MPGGAWGVGWGEKARDRQAGIGEGSAPGAGVTLRAAKQASRPGAIPFSPMTPPQSLLTFSPQVCGQAAERRPRDFGVLVGCFRGE